MKSTGIVRRIDDLGRVVIPKEIRRDYLKVRDGDPLEIYCAYDKEDGEPMVVFKRYDPANWERGSKEAEREFMRQYVAAHIDSVCIARSGRVTTAVYGGKAYSVTRYHKDKEDPTVALYEVLKKIFH